MRIHIIKASTRKKPRVGERRTTKKHGEQIRVFKRVRDMRGRVIGYDCTGGRHRFEWVPIAEAREHGAWHYWTDEERAKYDRKSPEGALQPQATT